MDKKLEICKEVGCKHPVHLFGQCYHHYYTVWEVRNTNESKK